MANDAFQVPPEMRALAEQSVEQAKKAIDGVMSATQQTMTSMEGHADIAHQGAREVSHKAMGFAEKNVAASFDFARKLVQAKNPDEVMKLQSEYMMTQMKAFADQAKELGQAAAETADKAKSG